MGLFDNSVMTVTEKPRPDEWMVVSDAADRMALFLEVGDTMRAGARKGIRRVLRSVPSEHDVEDVVVQSFNELCRKDRSRVNSIMGMAYQIAYRRGFDRGRRVMREWRSTRTGDVQMLGVPDAAPDHRPDEVAATMMIVRRCKERLTIDQQEVISATVEGTIDGTMPLKEYAQRRGTSYEACRRMLNRGIAALRRCVEAALKREKSDGG